MNRGDNGDQPRVVYWQPAEGMLLQEVDEAEGDRNRDLGRAVQATPLLDRAIGGVEATDTAVATQRDPTHAEAPRIK